MAQSIDFNKTKWNQSNWSIEHKRKWQMHMFSLGYDWFYGDEMISNLNGDWFYIDEHCMSYTVNKNPDIEEKLLSGFNDFDEKYWNDIKGKIDNPIKNGEQYIDDDDNHCVMIGKQIHNGKVWIIGEMYKNDDKPLSICLVTDIILGVK